MKKHILLLVALIPAMLLFPALSTAESGLIGKTLYLQSNVWFENPMKISSVNYHRGTILSAGTKVKVQDISMGGIRFVTLKNGLEYRILFSVKHFPGMDAEDLAELYFGEGDPLDSSTYSGFTAAEKKAIDEGRIIKGMSKKAVLMSYGYPPKHRTRSTDLNTWSYWNNRLFRMEVRFGKDDRVAQIIGGGR